MTNNKSLAQLQAESAVHKYKVWCRWHGMNANLATSLISYLAFKKSQTETNEQPSSKEESKSV